MRTLIITFASVGLLLILVLARPSSGMPRDVPACALVHQALADYGRIQPGTKRKDVERYFTFDGGLQFPDKGRYVYSQCACLKVEIEFEYREGEPFSPEDKVKSLSKLFVDVPLKD